MKSLQRNYIKNLKVSAQQSVAGAVNGAAYPFVFDILRVLRAVCKCGTQIFKGRARVRLMAAAERAEELGLASVF